MAKVQNAFYYADTETYNPETDPHFWYGGISDAKGKFKRFTDGVAFFKELIKPIRNKRKIVIFHNAGYDMSQLQYIARHELGWEVDPPVPGHKKAIYQGQFWEIYDQDHHLTIVVDSLPIIGSSIASWGKVVSKQYNKDYRKGDTPICHEHREPTQEEWDYVERDVEILRLAFNMMRGPEQVAKGRLTQSSMAQSSVKSYEAEYKGKKRHDMGLRPKYGRKERKDKKTPLPKAWSAMIKEQLHRFQVSEYIEDPRVNMDKVFYTVDEYNALDEETQEGMYRYTWDAEKGEEYKRKLIKYVMKRFEGLVGKEGIKEFKAWQKEPTKQFWNIPCPCSIEDLPDFLHEEIDYANRKIKSGVNNAIRGAMRGGISYINPKYQGYVVGAGMAIDANSMYPSILLSCEIPRIYRGMTEGGVNPNMGKYFVAEITKLKAHLKPNHHPWLKRQARVDKLYLEDLDWDKGVLTSVDINYMYETYDVEEIEYKRVFYFDPDPNFTKAIREHIKLWRKVKENPSSSAERSFAKIMLNTVWGRWGMYEKYVVNDGKRMDIGDKQTDMVSACFTTAYARVRLNRMANRFYDEFIYCDTDSVHLITDKTVEEVESIIGNLIDPKEFGKWKVEDTWDKARYIKSKTYGHALLGQDIGGHDKLHLKVAGYTATDLEHMLGHDAHENLWTEKERLDFRKHAKINTLEDFQPGLRLHRNRSISDQEGRQMIVPSPFVI